MIRDFADREEKIAALIVRYSRGELGEVTFEASLFAMGLRRDDIRSKVYENQATHRQSTPFLRGIVS